MSGLGAGMFLIFVLQATGGTQLFLFSKLSAKKGTRWPDSKLARSLFAYCRRLKERLCSSFQNYRSKKERVNQIGSASS